MTLRVSPRRIIEDSTGEILAEAPHRSVPHLTADDLVQQRLSSRAERSAAEGSPGFPESSDHPMDRSPDSLPPGWSPLDAASTLSAVEGSRRPPGFSPLDRFDRPGITIPMNTLLFAALAALLLWAAGVALLLWLFRPV